MSAFQYVYREITREEYHKYKDLSYAELSELVQSKLEIWIIYGYGYYGCSLVRKDDKYYIEIKIGSSCD